jgi:hypothetical protein
MKRAILLTHRSMYFYPGLKADRQYTMNSRATAKFDATKLVAMSPERADAQLLLQPRLE